MGGMCGTGDLYYHYHNMWIEVYNRNTMTEEIEIIIFQVIYFSMINNIIHALDFGLTFFRPK